MTAFVRAELRARWRMLAGLAAGAFVLLLIVPLSYHSFGVNGLGAAFHGDAPRGITALSGSRTGDFLSPAGWMGFGFNHPMFLVLTLTVAVGIGAGAIAGEVDSGRGELLFTSPVPRTRFLRGALVVWAVSEVVVVGGGLAGALLGASLSAEIRHAGLLRLLWAPVGYIPLALFVAACAFLASATARTRGRAVGAALGVTVLAYLINVVSSLLPSLGWLHWLTPFGYYDPAAAIGGGPSARDAAVLLAASGLLLALARAAVLRRDLA